MAIIEVRNVSYSYDGKKDVLTNISVAFEEGKM